MAKLASGIQMMFLVIVGLVVNVQGALLCDSNSPLCLEPRGQFPIPGECRKFANCWDSCASISSCPGTLVFSTEKRNCEFTWQVPQDSSCYKAMTGSIGHMPDIPPLSPMFTLAPLPGFGPLDQNQNQNQAFEMNGFNPLFQFQNHPQLQ